MRVGSLQLADAVDSFTRPGALRDQQPAKPKDRRNDDVSKLLLVGPKASFRHTRILSRTAP